MVKIFIGSFVFVDVGKKMNEPRVSGLSCLMINGSGEALFNMMSQSIVRRLLEDWNVRHEQSRGWSVNNFEWSY